MLKVITMTGYRRPEYTQRVLTALGSCYGIESWIFLPSVEPANDAVVSLFERFAACENRIHVNYTKMGLNKNTYQALSRALNFRADMVVHLEDDTVPSPDALAYFEWAIRNVIGADAKSKDGHHISIVSGYNKPDAQPSENESYRVDARPIFNCWGWGVDTSRLKWMISQWCFKDPNKFSTPFRQRFRRTRRECFPVLSRIQNIGVELGMNDTRAGRRRHYTPYVASCEPGNYSLQFSKS